MHNKFLFISFWACFFSLLQSSDFGSREAASERSKVVVVFMGFSESHDENDRIIADYSDDESSRSSVSVCNSESSCRTFIDTSDSTVWDDDPSTPSISPNIVMLIEQENCKIEKSLMLQSSCSSPVVEKKSNDVVWLEIDCQKELKKREVCIVNQTLKDFLNNDCKRCQNLKNDCEECLDLCVEIPGYCVEKMFKYLHFFYKQCCTVALDVCEKRSSE